MKPRLLKIARLPAMLDEALHAAYEVVEADQDGTGVGPATADIRA
jgi:hydroxypyruvate reductase